MKNIFFIVSIFIVTFFIGCASKTLDLKPKKPSTDVIKQFENYNCNQIDRKIAFLEKKAKRLARVQNDDAKSDRVLASWGWILYGVPYIFMNGNSETKEEFEAILGKKEALENIAINKNCNYEQKNIRFEYEGNY
jgi:hypothetical protein